MEKQVHLFTRPEAPHLMSPKVPLPEAKQFLKNQQQAIRQIDYRHGFRFLDLDGTPIKQTDKRFGMKRNSPLRHQREQVKLQELRFMQRHVGYKKK